MNTTQNDSNTVSEWNPIRTAPRDGTLVRLRSPKHGIVPALWSWDGERWTTQIIGIMGMVPAVWDENVQQPTEWASA